MVGLGFGKNPNPNRSKIFYLKKHNISKMLFYKFLLKYGLGFATLFFIAILEFKVWVCSLIFLGASPNPLER